MHKTGGIPEPDADMEIGAVGSRSSSVLSLIIKSDLVGRQTWIKTTLDVQTLCQNSATAVCSSVIAFIIQ